MKDKNHTYPVLYTFRRCPYAIRARMALSYSKIKVELKEILLNNRPFELYAVSPKGTVPVLCVNNITVIDESLDIMKWALKQNDPNSWMSYNKKMSLKSEIDNLKFILDSGICEFLQNTPVPRYQHLLKKDTVLKKYSPKMFFWSC